jgi:hypothetical protein
VGERTLLIKVERELVMRCAENATAEGISTAAWINRTLASAIEGLDAQHESAVAKPDAQPEPSS